MTNVMIIDTQQREALRKKRRLLLNTIRVVNASLEAQAEKLKKHNNEADKTEDDYDTITP